MRSSIRVLTLVGLAFGLWSCREAEVVEPDTTPRAVKYVELEAGGMAKTVEYPGQVRSAKESRMAFEVAGRIIEPVVKEGRQVKKGDLLARLDDRDYRFEFEEAEAEFEVAQAVEARLKSLHEKRAVSQQELDLAGRDLKKAAARLNRARKALDDTRLLAEFDGVVARVFVDDFANVEAKQDILIVLDPNALEIAIDVPESVMAIPMPGETPEERVANAKPVVILSALPGMSYPARFSEAAEQADAYTRTYKVTLSFSPEDTSMIRPGMTGKVRATVPAMNREGLNGFVVPFQAVVSDDEGKAHVWRIGAEDGVVEPVAVRLGTPGGEQVMVSGDLKAGDRIVASGVHRVRAGDKVRLWKQD